MFGVARARRGLLPRVLPLVLAWAVTGCAARIADPLLVAGRDLLSASRPPSDRAFADLNRFVTEHPDLAAAAAAELVGSEDERTRYAALYVLGLAADGETEVAALRRGLEDDAPHLRAIAAGSLIGLGEVEAIPALIELLSITDEIPGSAPAVFVDRFASEALTAYTGKDFGVLEAPSGTPRTAAQKRWRDWWAAVSSEIRWDAATQRYVW